MSEAEKILKFHRTALRAYAYNVTLFGKDDPSLWRDLASLTGCDVYLESADEIENGFIFGEDAV